MIRIADWWLACSYQESPAISISPHHLLLLVLQHPKKVLEHSWSGLKLLDVQYSWPSQHHSVVCRLWPYPRMVCAQIRWEPSSVHLEPCQLDLKVDINMMSWDIIEWPTKGDIGILFANIITLFIGKEHIGREATLWSIGIWYPVSDATWNWLRIDITLLFLASISFTLGLASGSLCFRHVDLLEDMVLAVANGPRLTKHAHFWSRCTVWQGLTHWLMITTWNLSPRK